MHRASEVLKKDKNAKLTLRRAAEIQELCKKGLEQLPAVRKAPQFSNTQVLMYARTPYVLHVVLGDTSALLTDRTAK